jgi:hypothetical protein
LVSQLIVLLPRRAGAPPHPPHAGGKGRNVAEHRIDQLRPGAPAGIEIGGEAPDQRGADDGGIGNSRHRCRLVRRLDAEADGERQPGVAAQPADCGADVRGGGGFGAGDAGDRDVVDEASGAIEHDGEPDIVGRRRGQPDEVDAGGEGRIEELVILLGRQIDDDETVDAASLGIGEEGRHAVAVDRVVIAHQHDRRRVVIPAKLAHEIERAAQGHAGLQRAQPRRLDRRPVGHRIGEWHAELDEIGARRGQAAQQRQRGRRIGIAGDDIGDEPGAAFGCERGEAARDAGLGHRRAPALGVPFPLPYSPSPLEGEAGRGVMRPHARSRGEEPWRALREPPLPTLPLKGGEAKGGRRRGSARRLTASLRASRRRRRCPCRRGRTYS